MEELEEYGQGMTIQEDDFILEQIDDVSPLWDLKLLRTVKGKTGTREEFKIDGYGMPLGAALNRIVHYRMKKKKANYKSIKEFMKCYALESAKITFIYKALSKLGISYGTKTQAH